MPPISAETNSSIVAEMDRLGSLTVPDFGLRHDDVHYLYIDTTIAGRGPDRLKYLDLEGRWKLSNRSVPYISAAFNHLERLNNAQTAFRLFSDEPLDAIGMMGWTPSEPVPKPEPKREKKPIVTIKPDTKFKEEVPPSPREMVPHRSAGYGPAHQKRKLSVHERAQSPGKHIESPILITDYDRFAKYQTKDLSLKMSSKGDPGYSSADERNSLETPSPRVDLKTPTSEDERRDHRADSLGNSYATKPPQYHISQTKPANANRVGGRYGDDLTVSVKETTKQLPYRSGGYGTPHLSRKYDLSPRSMGYSSASEQGSPYGRTASDVLVTTYHMTKTVRHERSPLQDGSVH